MAGPRAGLQVQRKTWPGAAPPPAAAHQDARLLSKEIHAATEADDVQTLSSIVRHNSLWWCVEGSSSPLRPSSLVLNMPSDDSGDTACFQACKRGNADCTRVLLAAGASGDVRNKFRETAGHAAARGGFRQCLWLLLRGGANVLHVHDELGELPFHAACYHNKRDCVKLLLAAGMHIDVPTEGDGLTGSIIAASLGHCDVLALLIANNANIHVATADGRTALHFAAAELNFSCMQLLLEYGADVHSRDSRGRTPIMALKSHPRGNVNEFNALLREYGAC